MQAGMSAPLKDARMPPPYTNIYTRLYVYYCTDASIYRQRYASGIEGTAKRGGVALMSGIV